MTDEYRSVLKSPNIDKPKKKVVALGGDGILEKCFILGLILGN